MNEQDKSVRLEEITDPNKVAVYCSKHQYYGPSKLNPDAKPKLGCSRCWFVFYLSDMINGVSPSERGKRLDELEEVINKLAEQVKKGHGDQFNVFRHPEITYEEE